MDDIRQLIGAELPERIPCFHYSGLPALSRIAVSRFFLYGYSATSGTRNVEQRTKLTTAPIADSKYFNSSDHHCETNPVYPRPRKSHIRKDSTHVIGVNVRYVLRDFLSPMIIKNVGSCFAMEDHDTDVRKPPMRWITAVFTFL